jgi:DNA-binding beta-propeller fold protein YncE
MSFRRVGWLAAMFVATLFWMSCGEVYRPVVIPIANNPPNPANFHAVFGISTNVAPNPGTALQIDVPGDSNIGVTRMGINPTHAAILPNNSRVFVASAGSVVNGNADVITSFTASSTGIGTTTSFSFPNVGPNQSSAITAISQDPNSNLVTVTLTSQINSATIGGPIVISGVIIQGGDQTKQGAYNGNFTITSISGNIIQYNDPVGGLLSASGGTATVPFPTFCSYQPDFITTTQTSAVYLANYGQENGANCNLPSTDSVAALNTINNTVANIAYLPAGSHPVLLAETPNAQNLYVVNQGDGTGPTTVMNLSPVDLSTIATIPIGVNPSWIATRPDGQFVYVVTQGDGLLYTINTAMNTVMSAPQSVGIGANHIVYDKSMNRLYVTSPVSGLVYVFSATGNAPTPLATPSGNPPGALMIPPVKPCAAAPANCGPVTPVSVAALPDGSRFYVASYQTQSPCSDVYAGPGSCIIPMVTVFDAKSLTIRTASSSYFGAELSLLSSPPFGPVDLVHSIPPQYAVPEAPSCAPAAIYTPGSTRFRMFATAAADSSHVYVSICDAGAIADISTTTNTVTQGTNAEDRLVIDLMAPFSAGAPGVNNQPPPQSPVFLLTGQ